MTPFIRSRRFWQKLIKLLTAKPLNYILPLIIFIGYSLFAGDRLNPLSAQNNFLPQPHPLPETLQQWQDPSSDYFSEIEPIENVGYLIWSQFPVTVYIQQPETDELETFAGKALETWANFVLAAIAEWNVYLPLEIVPDPENADIQIWRRRPPLRLSETGEILPARSAQVSYEFYALQQEDLSPEILAHRFIILLSPTQTGSYIQSAARHELGHALGIWGHSPVETDVMYRSQVRHPPTISPRDINTLRRIYQQPTYLGWPMIF
jgi:predicted Zn-dependent protease